MVQAVKEAPVDSPSKQGRYLKHLKKERCYFPLLPELKDVITDQWSKTERKTFLQSRLMKLYPFKAEEVQHFETAPLVDAALMRLAKYVPLLLEGTVSKMV